MRNSLTFDVFGTLVVVEKRSNRWQAYYPGTDGKRRPATEIVIPTDTSEADLEQYLADLCHEWATPVHQEVVRITNGHKRNMQQPTGK